MDKVLWHFINLAALHENNAIVVFSPILTDQIPRSYAANAFNVFQHVMRDFEIVRLCALWDRAGSSKESIPTVVELIDHGPIIDALAEEERAHWAKTGAANLASVNPDLSHLEKQIIKAREEQFGDARAANVKSELREAITSARRILSDPLLNELRNYRDKHLAHALETTWRETDGPIPLPKYGHAMELFESSIPIVENLHRCVTGKGFSIADSRKI